MEKDNLYFVLAVIILIGAMVITSFNQESITGQATVTGKGRGSYYGGNWDDGYRISLTQTDVNIRNAQWAVVKGTGLLDKIVDKFQLSTPQIRAWVGLTAWVNDKIYSNTFACIRDSKTSELFIGIKYRREGSWWPGWDVIYMDASCYDLGGGKQVLVSKTQLGYVYINKATGEVKT